MKDFSTLATFAADIDYLFSALFFHEVRPFKIENALRLDIRPP
jgi:hypothetical protein